MVAEDTNKAKISVVIPTLNASGEIDRLLFLLENQTLKPLEILVVDSSSDDDTVDIAKFHDLAQVKVIKRSDFNHGLTRHWAFQETVGDYVLFMTQDAVPADGELLERIVAPMEKDPQICQVTGRQLPKPEARPFERLVREFNYPEQSNIRSMKDVDQLGIKAYFSSDVCCCYRRSAYLEVGGFGETDMSEDMLMSITLLRAGYKIAYAADARVFHSHNYTPRQQFNRNRAVGRFLEQHKKSLNGVNEMGEGISLVRKVSESLLLKGHVIELVGFGVDCLARVIGNRVGRAEIRNNSQ